MKKRITKTDFKAVEFMRNQRDELSELYVKKPVVFWKQLEEVRARFKDKFHQKQKRAAKCWQKLRG